ncbi:hypothetical protein EV561_1736 [Rhizobium sp. BK376]|nr:hypothetical protein EV561_1736 [Rhizobium sp. BK376]
MAGATLERFTSLVGDPRKRSASVAAVTGHWFDSLQEPSPALTEKRFHGDGVDEFGHHASMFRQSTLSPLIFISSDLSEQELADSPLAINGMKLLRYAEQSGGIPLTQSLGAFHRKCVEWAAHEFRWPGFEPDVLYSVNKVLNEPDFPPLSILHQALQELRLIRHYKGTAVLTKTAGLFSAIMARFRHF